MDDIRAIRAVSLMSFAREPNYEHYFTRWIKYYDRVFRDQKRHVHLWLDNFSGHSTSYMLTNICMEMFKPNMTSFIQPLDAGIIHCFKAHYRRIFCLHAIDLDEAGEENIYKINLLEVMLTVKEAWACVSQETIKNCWAHAFALMYEFLFYFVLLLTNQHRKDPVAKSTSESSSDPITNPAVWQIIDFAANKICSLPQAEEQLGAYLGGRFSFLQWKPAFDEVFKAEGDASAALEAVEALKSKVTVRHLTQLQAEIQDPMSPNLSLPELESTELELMQVVDELHRRRRIIGTRPTLEDLLNPVEEKEVGHSPYRYPGGDNEIIEEVRKHKDTPADQVSNANGRASGDSDDEDGVVPEFTAQQGLDLCAQMEQLCLQHASEVDSGIDINSLQRQVWKLHGHLRKLDTASQKQVTLDRFFHFSV